MTDLVRVVPAPLEWLEALMEGDDAFTERFAIPVVAGWVGFPEALPHAVDGARRRSEDPWGTQLVFDAADGALVGFGGFKGPPAGGEVELGYAIAPVRRGRGFATAFVAELLDRAESAGVTTVTAHTLAQANASTTVLERSGFAHTATLADPEEGGVWRWERPLAD